MKIPDFEVGKEYVGQSLQGDFIITVVANDGKKVRANWVRVDDPVERANGWEFNEHKLEEYNFKIVSKLYRALK